MEIYMTKKESKLVLWEDSMERILTAGRLCVTDWCTPTMNYHVPF